MENIIGRNEEIQSLFWKLALKEEIFFQITGESGSGKITLVKQTANYLFQRRFFKDEIICQNMERINSIENLISKIKKGISSEKKFCEINQVFFIKLCFFFFLIITFINFY